jgi:hypothetical protein
MPSGRQVPHPNTTTRDHEQRVSALERKRMASIDARRDPFIFSFSGPLEDDVPSPKMRMHNPCVLTLITADLTVAGSGDVIFDLKRGSTVIITVTIPSGELSTVEAEPLYLGRDALLSAVVTQSSGAEDLGIAISHELT